MSQTEDYWKEQKEHSRVKSEIVAAYLLPWAGIIGQHCENLYYLDLFSGKGRFDCGSPSTPMMIMDQLSERPDLAGKIRLSFYEAKPHWLENLETEIKSHKAINLLPEEPFFKQQTIDAEFAEQLSGCITSGTYSFIDPWGYADITLDLLDVVTREWGCDCVFYLSISGIVRNLRQEEKWPKLEQFFGAATFNGLIEMVRTMAKSDDISTAVLTALESSLSRLRGYRILEYLVEFDDTKRPSHYLVFLTKNKRGFKIMRDIMLKRGLKDQHGIPSLTFSPRRLEESNQLSFQIVTPADNLGRLCKKVMSDFSGGTLLVSDLMESCLEASYPFTDAHVRKALVELRKQGKLDVVDAPTEKARSIIGNKVVVRLT